MDQKECNIIIDLLPNYIEGDISNDTKRFIDEHLNKCLKCRDTLKAMKEDITEEDKRIRIDNDIMTNKIKKIKRKMTVKRIRPYLRLYLRKTPRQMRKNSLIRWLRN